MAVDVYLDVVAPGDAAVVVIVVTGSEVSAIVVTCGEVVLSFMLSLMLMQIGVRFVQLHEVEFSLNDITVKVQLQSLGLPDEPEPSSRSIKWMQGDVHCFVMLFVISIRLSLSQALEIRHGMSTVFNSRTQESPATQPRDTSRQKAIATVTRRTVLTTAMLMMIL